MKIKALSRIRAIGGSLIVTIPKEVVKEQSLQEGELVELELDKLKIDVFGDWYNTDVKTCIDDLDRPKKILEKLLPALITGAENNQEKMKEFEMSLRFLKAMSDESEDEK